MKEVRRKSGNKFCCIEELRDGGCWISLYDRSHTILDNKLSAEQYLLLLDTIMAHSDAQREADRTKYQVVSLSSCPVPLGPEPSALGN